MWAILSSCTQNLKIVRFLKSAKPNSEEKKLLFYNFLYLIFIFPIFASAKIEFAKQIQGKSKIFPPHAEHGATDIFHSPFFVLYALTIVGT